MSLLGIVGGIGKVISGVIEGNPTKVIKGGLGTGLSAWGLMADDEVSSQKGEELIEDDDN